MMRSTTLSAEASQRQSYLEDQVIREFSPTPMRRSNRSRRRVSGP
jgi:hypothetical protein